MNVGERIEINRIEGEICSTLCRTDAKFPDADRPLYSFNDCHILGYLQSRIIFFLMVCHPFFSLRYYELAILMSLSLIAHQNIHNRPRTIYFARSGQSLIEHSYKADSDLSPAGWDYAERLKEAVMSRRRQVAEERRLKGEVADESKKLVVSLSSFLVTKVSA